MSHVVYSGTSFCVPLHACSTEFIPHSVRSTEFYSTLSSGALTQLCI